MDIEPIRWGDQRLTIIDQTLLPSDLKYIELSTLAEVSEAIKALRVRGAPAIGICAAFGILVALNEKKPSTIKDALILVRNAAETLAATRPTAVNLSWSVQRIRAVAEQSNVADVPSLLQELQTEANTILQEDKTLCHAIGEHGENLIQDDDGILTHCNAGGLATSGYGTALAPIFHAHNAGRNFKVFVDETRPLLQGARLTAWELMKANIDTTLICDSAAAHTMAQGMIQLVIVGADRIAANGDTANKIGTYSVALLAQAHNIPFYVAAPYSTFDRCIQHGAKIPIESRDPKEITNSFGFVTAPKNVKVLSPAFDITPANLITGFITEKAILTPPFDDSIAKAMDPTSTVDNR